MRVSVTKGSSHIRVVLARATIRRNRSLRISRGASTIAEDLHEWTGRGTSTSCREWGWGGGRDKRRITVEKRGRIYGGKSQSGACNYRSDRYANGWIITVGARCRARPRRARSLARSRTERGELTLGATRVINVSFASGIDRSALLAVYSAARIRERFAALRHLTAKQFVGDVWYIKCTYMRKISFYLRRKRTFFLRNGCTIGLKKNVLLNGEREDVSVCFNFWQYFFITFFCTINFCRQILQKLLLFCYKSSHVRSLDVNGNGFDFLSLCVTLN